jgi:hypothetical protein
MLALLIAVLPPSPATAGGWWSFIETNRSTVAAGQRVEAEASLMFSSKLAARRAQDRQFYVYALRRLDRSTLERAMTTATPGDWWSLGDAEAVELGPVALRVGDGNIGRARAVFTVPELPVRTYALMFCDAGCARPLADVVPTRGFTVVADPATAELAERARRLEARLAAAQRGSLAAARAAGRRARTAAANADSELRALDERVRALEREVAEAASAPGRPFRALAGWVLAGVAAGALAVLMLRRRSAKRPLRAFGGWQPSDEELKALIASQRSRSRPPRVRT